MFQCLFNPIDCALTNIPWWLWLGGFALLAGGIWKWFGWQGVASVAAAAAVVGSYIKGWQDRGAGKKPIVPVEDDFDPPLRPTTRKPTLLERIRQRRGEDE